MNTCSQIVNMPVYDLQMSSILEIILILVLYFKIWPYLGVFNVTQWLSYQSGVTLNPTNLHIMAKNSRGNFEQYIMLAPLVSLYEPV